MSVTAAGLKKFAPELAQVDNARLNIFIRIATRQVNPTYFQDQTEDGVLLLSAHYATLGNREGAGGAVTGERVGDLSRQYSSSLDKSKLCSTSYGEMFWDMLITVRPIPTVLGGC